MLLNIGPAHPAMHGIIRIVAKLEGERIQEADVEIGYLHRGFEKMSETVDYNGVIPYTDRLNYVSPLINNMGYCMTVEKLLGITVPERCHYIRVIMSEISRITDHLTCVGASAMELGAFSVFLYMIKAREYLWDLVEKVTGARMTVSYCRVGGVKADLPSDFGEPCLDIGLMLPSGHPMGDVNCNGAVNSVDALLILRAVAGRQAVVSEVDVHRVDADRRSTAKMVQRAVARDPVKPRPGVDRPVVGEHRVEGRRKHLLQHVLGVLARAEHVAAEGEQARFVARAQRLEGRVLPMARQLDELLIGLQAQQRRGPPYT